MNRQKPPYTAVRWLMSRLLVIALLAGSTQFLFTTSQSASEPTLGDGPKISEDLQDLMGRSLTGDPTVSVILQTDRPISSGLSAFLSGPGVTVRSTLNQLQARNVELPLSKINELASFTEASFISPDRSVKSLGHLTATSGADAVRSLSVGGQTGSYDGSGITVAVLDSAIYNTHRSLLEQGSTSVKRTVLYKDFTGLYNTSYAD